MAGKRLLDIAALLNASHGAAWKHAALRSQQLEVWRQTSSIPKALKSQADHVAQSFNATSILTSLLNNNSKKWADANNQQPSPKSSSEQDLRGTSASNEFPSSPSAAGEEVYQENFPSRPLTVSEISNVGSNVTGSKHYKDISSERRALLQREIEHAENAPRHSSFDNLMQQRTTETATPSSNLPSTAADAENVLSGKTLAQDHDGVIFYEPAQRASPDLSSLPRTSVPRQTSRVQDKDEHTQSVGLNLDRHSSATAQNEVIPPNQAIPKQEQVPEDVNIDLFRSPRVARMLGAQIETEPKNVPRTQASGTASHESMTLQSDINVGENPELEFVLDTQDSRIKRDELAPTANEKSDAGVVDGPHARDHVFSALNPLAAPYEMKESRVPSSRIGRLWNYGGLAAGMFGGAISESIRRATGNGGEGSYILSASNVDRLVGKLSKMRGAALKLGQMMSFQDSKMLPGPIQNILLRVQDSADYMPPSQRNKVLASNLGSGWRDLFSSFDEKPIAAASIGQVHSAVLRSTGMKVAVKVQYPGVADSIDSDLGNLAVLLTASRLLPKGLYLEKTIANARTELAWECDYVREAECGQRFRELLSDEKDVFVVPETIPEASGKQVLTMEYVEGVGVTKIENLEQSQKDWIGTQILRLCLREITEFKFMQTDPNWTNFLYNEVTNKLGLVDFGASRDYPDEFISNYTRLLLAASKSDREGVRSLSIKLGYLTGHESKAMLDAHIASVLTLAEPFLASSPDVYDFRDQTITDRVKALIPVMVRERLAPPPEETYSLHRKLSGAFLLCAKLGSSVNCRELFKTSMTNARLY